MTLKHGDSLGRLVDPPTANVFEAARLTMADQLLAGKPTGRLPHASWLAALELGVHGVTDQVMAVAQQEMTAAALRSRYPARKLAAQLPGTGYREMLYHRLLSAGIPLERLEMGDDDPTVQRNRGVALESAWDDVLIMAEEELQRWRGNARAMQEWRRPTAGLWVGSAVALTTALTLAAWLGGVLPAPRWFDPIGMAFWGLPWGGGS